jgi:hypothetical protein
MNQLEMALCIVARKVFTVVFIVGLIFVSLVVGFYVLFRMVM